MGALPIFYGIFPAYESPCFIRNRCIRKRNEEHDAYISHRAVDNVQTMALGSHVNDKVYCFHLLRKPADKSNDDARTPRGCRAMLIYLLYLVVPLDAVATVANNIAEIFCAFL